MRLDVHLPTSLDDRRIDRIMPAPGTERGERAFVVVDCVTEIVLRECRMAECRSDVSHEFSSVLSVIRVTNASRPPFSLIIFRRLDFSARTLPNGASGVLFQ